MLFDGPVDSAVSATVADELVATLREALSNVARHARAHRTEVEVLVADEVVLRVADDGTGPRDVDAPAGNGLRNMAARAEKLGGSFELAAGETAGSVLVWRVPVQ